MHGAKRSVPDRVADRERAPQRGEAAGGGPLIRALATGAVVAWAVGAVAMPIAAWIWLRAGGRRPAVALVALAAGLVGQVAWLYDVASGGLDVVLVPDRGIEGVAAWAFGFTGLAALAYGLKAGAERGWDGLLDPDPAFQIAFGLFGLGVLLQQIARALA